MYMGAALSIRIRLKIRIRLDRQHFAGSDSASSAHCAGPYPGQRQDPTFLIKKSVKFFCKDNIIKLSTSLLLNINFI
jgi:hypothetical protein